MATTSLNPGGATTATSITAVHSDIIQTHILTRVDGPTLASTACTSQLLHTLCSEHKLWHDICNSTWTSVRHPRVQQAISTFPGGHRSFFSDSYPILHHKVDPTTHRRNHDDRVLRTSELISAVDIRYKNEPVYSKVLVENVSDENFMCSTLWVDLLDRKETVKIPVTCEDVDQKLMSNFEENMTLSWIIIDPTRKRAANVSSVRPVSVQPHWFENDIEVKYATIMTRGDRVGSELVECKIVAVFGVKEGGELELKEVNMHVQDMDRRSLNGRDSLVILQEAMESGRRLMMGSEGEEKQRYREYVDMKRERRERNIRREGRLEMVSRILWATSFMSSVYLIVSFCNV